ncbi:MAG: DUF975 family protein [Candidatus Paceibacterota bacterium]
MERLSVKNCLSFGWNSFTSKPWLFVQVTAIVILANIAISLVQSGYLTAGTYLLGSNSDIAVVFASVVGMGLSFLVSMGKTAFYLGAHDSIKDTSAQALWHPYPYLKFVATSLLVGLVVVVGLILIIPGIIAGVIFGFSLYIIIEENLNPIDAMRKSAQLTKGNRMQLFVLGLALIGINILGILALLVGLLVSLPVSSLAIVHAYRTLSGKTEVPLKIAMS